MASFADGELNNYVDATAVRRRSPGLFLQTVVDPAYLGLAENRENVASSGEVDCLTVTDMPRKAGSVPDPSRRRVVQCQRTGPNLTVSIRPYGVDDPSLDDAVAMTNELWDALSATGL